MQKRVTQPEDKAMEFTQSEQPKESEKSEDTFQFGPFVAESDSGTGGNSIACG